MADLASTTPTLAPALTPTPTPTPAPIPSSASAPTPVALVTGGGAGIGAAVCARLAALGRRVVVVDIDADAARRVADAVGGAAFRADVADPGDNRAMVAYAVERYGRLDLAVLNAGISPDQSPDEPLSVERYRRAAGVNVDGVVFGIDAAVPELARRQGTIVVTASLAALDPSQANPVYAMGKSAVVGYVRAMSVPLAKRGVTINAVCPGFTDTAILGIAKRLMRKQGFPLLTPDEVAEAVLTVLDKAGTGEAWALVVGRPPAPFDFPAVPVSLLPDGTEVRLRPFLTPR
jgi:NAD(P)-dependent dehydrogenase (short-subunit alcohol dehydrogenase family)